MRFGSNFWPRHILLYAGMAETATPRVESPRSLFAKARIIFPLGTNVVPKRDLLMGTPGDRARPAEQTGRLRVRGRPDQSASHAALVIVRSNVAATKSFYKFSGSSAFLRIEAALASNKSRNE